MHLRSLKTIGIGALVAMAVGVMPPSAEACACGGPSSTGMSFRAAQLVFVGRVAAIKKNQTSWVGAVHQNPDGSVSQSGGGAGGLGLTTVSFDVSRIYAGHSINRVTLLGSMSDCDVPFAMGETWLVFARETDSSLTTNKCTRTRLMSAASEDVKYLEGLAASRPQGVIYGNVNQQVTGPDGRGILRAPSESLDVVAVGHGGRFHVATEPWGAFQLVLPPGDFVISIERHGQRVSSTITVLIQNGTERQLALAAAFQ